MTMEWPTAFASVGCLLVAVLGVNGVFEALADRIRNGKQPPEKRT